jgi:hypothetical protein
MTLRIALGGVIVLALSSQPARGQVTPSQAWALFITTAEAAQAFSMTGSMPAPPPPAPPLHHLRKFEVLSAWLHYTGHSKDSLA